MTTNKEWLFSLPLDEQIAWMNQEHVEDANGTLEATTAPVECQPMRDLLDELDALESQCNALARDLGECMADRDYYRMKFGKCLDYADAVHALMDEGMA